LTGALDQLRLWGVGGHEKFVPEAYKWASAQDRLSVLQGLMDTDGTRDYRRGTGAEFYSHSRQLAEDVAFLARSLGGSARVRSKRDGWRVAVDEPLASTGNWTCAFTARRPPRDRLDRTTRRQ